MMLTSTIILVLLHLLEPASANPILSTDPILAIQRALNDNALGYTPSRTSCPATKPSVRPADNLGPDETQWLRKRRAATRAPLRDLLVRSNIVGFSAGAYLDGIADDAALPNIALAMSGGGYRALLNGAGALAAWDARTEGAMGPGGLGGLLQASTYVSGLSGGGWLVGSVYSNNFSSVEQIVRDAETGRTKIWNFERSMLEGPKASRIPGASIIKYWRGMLSQVRGKKSAGFETSLTDYWSRGLAYQMINDTLGGPAHTWSEIAEQPKFAEGQEPMPILVACGRAPGELLVPRNTTVFEFTPYEIGSWDPTLNGMAPMKYAGTRFQNGTMPQDEACVTGFDNAAFVMGTSSTLFNAVINGLYQAQAHGLLSVVMDWVKELAEKINKDDNDIANWTPNPFKGWSEHDKNAYHGEDLGLVDGGMDAQNIPLYPVIQPHRKVDVIFAVDSSADTGRLDGWPNGTSLVATYERHVSTKGSSTNIANGTSFPSIPDPNTFINLGLVSRPTFFGCDAKNSSEPTPLIVYLANTPYTFYSNLSTKVTTITDEERGAMIKNGYHMATMGNGTVEKEWQACVSCAILSRSFDRSNTQPPPLCVECFKKHCWNGTTDPTPPQSKYSPTLLMPDAADKDIGKPKIINTNAASGSRRDRSILALSLVTMGIHSVV